MVAQGDYHRPVMVAEALVQLEPRPDGLYLDGTVGGGGHAAAILEACAPDGRLLGADRDEEAQAAARSRLACFGDRVRLLLARFDELPARWAELGHPRLDGILLDLGVSSHQLETAERGFSFQQSGPLDMRMDRGCGRSAAELLAELDERRLVEVLQRGEVPQARRLARVLHAEAAAGRLATTTDLARAVERSTGRRSSRSHHPATLVFQALRLEVNEELIALRRFLEWLPEPLAAGGRAVVISYHSLEDRQVKQAFQALSRGCTCPPRLPVCGCGRSPLGRVLTRQAVQASDAEVAANPRARSATLRCWEKNR